MPAFTAIAVAVVGWIGATGLAATILTTVIATGLAMVTSRLINGNPGGGSGAGAESTGTRVQLQPDTANKIPVIYGEGYFSSMVTDAYLHDENKYMTYVMVIGETVNQNARFQGSISVATSRLTAVDVSDGDYGTIMTGMRLTNSSGQVVGVVEEFISGVYGGPGVYRVSNPVETAAQLLDGGFVYTVEDIYWNDMRLVFENGQKTGKAIQGRKHVENLPRNPDTGAANEEDHKDDNFKDHAEVYIYAGNSTSSAEIGTTATKVAAYRRVGTNSTAYKWLAPGTAGAEQMEGLIFAVVKVKYDAEKGFTGIPGMTFKIKCSLDNPAVALFDYMRSNRYGAGISAGSINAAALGDFANYCNELVSYQPYGSTAAPTTQKRYTINGLIDTNRNCKDNIDTILMNAGAWMSYDVHTGQWRVIPKRAVESNPAYPNRVLPTQLLRFTDDNIIGGITISSTRLDDLYNIAELEYFDRLNKDQRGFHSIEVNTADRNYNEPDNAMRLTLDLCNSNVQAERVANLELKQARDDVLVQFKTTHYGLQAQAGDVIQLESSLYGWQAPVFPNGKKFRIITAKEIEGTEGALYAELTALEYNEDVYTDEDISEFTTSQNIGIVPRNSSVNIPAPIVKIEQDKVNARGGVPNFRIKIEMPSTGGPYDEVQLWYSEGDDWAGVGGETQFLGDATGDRIYVTTFQGPAVIRALQNTAPDQGVKTTISGKGIAEGTYITAFGATNSPYYGNGLTGYYTLSQPVETRTGIIQFSGEINDAQFTATINDTTMTVTGATAGTIDLQSLIQGGVESAQISSATVSGTTLSVFALTGTIVANANTGTIIQGQGLMPNTRVLTQVTSTEPGGALGGRGTYTISRSQSLNVTDIVGLYPNLLKDTIITSGPSEGGNGTYTINKSQTIGTPFTVTSKYAYPLPSTYQYLKSMKPDPGATLLFDQNSLRETFISSLPANSLNKKYFIKARLGIAGSYGAFSELGEVDTEPPVVYWEPDSQSALNIKTELVKMDFGKFTIPRNGLWLMRTATQLDGGHIQTPTGDTFNLDLGNFEAEREIGANDLIEDFTHDPLDL